MGRSNNTGNHEFRRKKMTTISFDNVRHPHHFLNDFDIFDLLVQVKKKNKEKIFPDLLQRPVIKKQNTRQWHSWEQPTKVPFLSLQSRRYPSIIYGSGNPSQVVATFFLVANKDKSVSVHLLIDFYWPVAHKIFSKAATLTWINSANFQLKIKFWYTVR